MADDVSIQHHITSLIDEEHRLRSALQDGSITVDEERARLRNVEVELDQCWDLLRQRRAKREFGEDPDEAQVRPERTVEGYIG
jgi:phage terminase Nu1 subunit (DNA packaging protein)